VKKECEPAVLSQGGTRAERDQRRATGDQRRSAVFSGRSCFQEAAIAIANKICFIRETVLENYLAISHTPLLEIRVLRRLIVSLFSRTVFGGHKCIQVQGHRHLLPLLGLTSAFDLPQPAGVFSSPESMATAKGVFSAGSVDMCPSHCSPDFPLPLLFVLSNTSQLSGYSGSFHKLDTCAISKVS